MIEDFEAFVQTVPATSKRLTIKAPDTRGLFVRINPGGQRTWVAMTRDPDGKQVWLTLGDIFDLSLAAARLAVGDFRRRTKRGERVAGIDIKSNDTGGQVVKLVSPVALRYRAARDADPEAFAAKSRVSALKTKYGLQEGEFEAILAAQGGGCSICGSKDPRCGRTGRFYVDHCHDTNRVRGLLCKSCNTALGLFKDDSAAMARAIEYLDVGKSEYKLRLLAWRALNSPPLSPQPQSVRRARRSHIRSIMRLQPGSRSHAMFG